MTLYKDIVTSFCSDQLARERAGSYNHRGLMPWEPWTSKGQSTGPSPTLDTSSLQTIQFFKIKELGLQPQGRKGSGSIPGRSSLPQQPGYPQTPPGGLPGHSGHYHSAEKAPVTIGFRARLPLTPRVLSSRPCDRLRPGQAQLVKAGSPCQFQALETEGDRWTAYQQQTCFTPSVTQATNKLGVGGERSHRRHPDTHKNGWAGLDSTHAEAKQWASEPLCHGPAKNLRTEVTDRPTLACLRPLPSYLTPGLPRQNGLHSEAVSLCM